MWRLRGRRHTPGDGRVNERDHNNKPGRDLDVNHHIHSTNHDHHLNDHHDDGSNDDHIHYDHHHSPRSGPSRRGWADR